MQLQFQKTAIRCLGTALQEVQSAEVTQELRLPEGMPDIGRVLTSWGQVIIKSKEWQGNAILLTGGVLMWTLYAPEDGTEPRSVDSWLPFQLKWDVHSTDREGPMRMMPLLTFADSRSISARKMMLRAGVAAMVQAMYPMDAEIYSPGEVPEDVQILQHTYPVSVPVESGEKTFRMDEEFLLTQETNPAEKLLSIVVSPEIGEKRILSDKVIFKGNLNVHLVCRNSEGEIKSYWQVLPFSQLSELDRNYQTDASADIQMVVTGLEADMGEPGKVRIKCGLVAQYLVSERHKLELVQDAYSTNRSVEPDRGMLELPVILEDLRESVTAEQSLPGQTGDVVDVMFLPGFPRKRFAGKEPELELHGIFQTLLYDENHALQGINTRWEGKLPWKHDGQVENLYTVNSPEKVRSFPQGDSLNLSAQMQLGIQTGTLEQIPMIRGLELGQIQEADANRPSVILCNCENDNLWELAKRNGSTVSAIRMANGLDEQDICENRMLLIPVL